MFSSLLEGAPGIGDTRKKELLKRFGSLKKLKEASIEELSEILGNTTAKDFYNYLHSLEL